MNVNADLSLLEYASEVSIFFKAKSCTANIISRDTDDIEIEMVSAKAYTVIIIHHSWLAVNLNLVPLEFELSALTQRYTGGRSANRHL